MTDLGTLGGEYSSPFRLNDAGDVAGYADPPNNQPALAVLWQHGRITDLDLLKRDTYSFAEATNREATVVGQSCNLTTQTCRALVWRKGGPMVDLNALVEPPSDLHLETAYAISDRGEIFALGRLPNGDFRIGVLTTDRGCDSNCQRLVAEYENNPPLVQPAATDATLPEFGSKKSVCTAGPPLARIGVPYTYTNVR